MPGLFAGTPLERPVTCEHCGQPHGRCACPRNRQGKVVVPKDQPARVRREKRGGKTVTVIFGIDLAEPHLRAMAAELKKALSTGGTLAGEEIEVQGDHRERVIEWLKARGYPAKAAGG